MKGEGEVGERERERYVTAPSYAHSLLLHSSYITIPRGAIKLSV